MARLFLISMVLAALANPAAAMFEKSGVSVRAEGMAGAFIGIADDVGAASVNPAGLARIEGTQFAGTYKLLFGGVGVNLHSGNFGYGMAAGRWGTFGIAGQETGFELHSERTVRLVHGFDVHRDVSFGYGLNGYNLYQQEVGSGFAFGLDLGMLARIYKVWSVGFSAHNINLPKIGTGPEGEMPWRLGFGLGFTPSPGIVSALDVSKEPGRPTRIAVGQEFRIIRDYLTLRAGVQTEPVRFACGLRTGTKNIHIDYALKTHALLPLEHDVGVMVEF